MSTKLHRSPPFRAEHLGSMKRPEELPKKRQQVYDGGATWDELHALEDAAIKDIVQAQIDLGFHPITDGEYRRHMFWGSFFQTLEGFEEISNPEISIFRLYAPDIAAFIEAGERPGKSVICTGKIKHTGKSSYMREVEYVQSLIPKEKWGEMKLTLAAPTWYHFRYTEGHSYPKEVYSTDAEYFHDIALAYQVELDILYKAGIRNVTIDDPNFAYFCSEKFLDGYKEDKKNSITSDELFDTYIKLYNDSISKRPADMHVGLHLCRGNYVGSRHFSEGGYDRIAKALFQDLNVDTFYLEYDTPRAGGFEPLVHLPKHKNIILGVVTSKFPELEDKEEMKKRIYSAADLIATQPGGSRTEALNRLGVSPQCGFASHMEGNLVTIDDMKKKLKLVREIANEIWPGEP